MIRRLSGRLGGDYHVALGLVVVTGVALVSVLVFSGMPRGIYDKRGETVKAVFPSTAVMYKDAPVRVNGVSVGRVKKMTPNEGSGTATVEMAIRDEGMPLYKDATAEIDFTTLLGGNYTIDLDRGTPRAGKLDPLVIPKSQTELQVEVDQILAGIREPEQAGLQTLVAEVPEAVRDDPQPSRALDTVASASPALRRGVGALRGERPNRDLRVLVENTGRAARAFDAPAESVRELIEGGAVTVETTARRESDISSTIDRAARVLPEVDLTVDRLDHTLGLADPVLERLRGPAAEIAPTLARLRPTLSQTDRLLLESRPLLRSLRPAVTSLASASREGRPLLVELTPTLKRSDQRILPDLAKPYEDSGRPTYQMLGPGVTALHSLAGAFDNVSGLVTLVAGGGERAIETPPCKTYFTDPSSDEYVRCVEIGEALKRYLEFRPVQPGDGQ